MKRLLILIVTLFCAFAYTAQAQDYTSYDVEKMTPAQFRRYKFDKLWDTYPKFEVRAGFGGLPLIDMLRFGVDDIVDEVRGPSYPRYSLDYIYQPQEGATYMVGLFTAEFSWHVKKWFSLAGQLTFNGFYGSVVDPSSGDKIARENGLSFSFIPYARFYWANFAKCRLYSAVGVGVNLYGHQGVSQALPAVQLIPIGITAGKRVFFFAEYAMGSVYYGGQLGVGYRF